MSGLLDVIAAHPVLAFFTSLCFIGGAVLTAVGIAVAGTERKR